ncbi:MAG: aminotransferase class I/II-fold pyridoxal phosphate-dependent enzyme [Pseudomonadota bacterium]|nr:aminotransferase class I/II-fold pyridoxal phosphate-dependent enzyme [Pseudomonadota bacterium]
MLNERLALLRDYPFRRLNALLADIHSPAGEEELIMSIGEPQHPYPEFVNRVLADNARLWGKYPPTAGTRELRESIANWLHRRYGPISIQLDPDRNILPVAGTREALFLVSLMATPQSGGGPKPAILMPDPFYQIYSGAAVMAGAEPVYLPTSEEAGFLPDLTRLPEETLRRTALTYVCSPSNPQGAAATPDQFCKYIEVARKYDFVLAVDECYSEIYFGQPLPGVLTACDQLNAATTNVLTFHSLSKRSNVPGLRSGFVAGDPRLIKSFGELRQYTGNASPGPVLAAAAALWQDETHVEANRKLYREKFEDAEILFSKHPCFYKPDGGFYLWLKVGDGEAITRALWQEAGVKVMPGRFLSAEKGNAPGASYIRVALVHSRQKTAEGLRRMAALL